MTKEVIRWLTKLRDRSKPFFLFVCFHEPHEPIATDEQFARLYPWQDIGETTDLAAREPVRLKRLAERLRRFYREVRDETPLRPEWQWPRCEAQRIAWE